MIPRRRFNRFVGTDLRVGDLVEVRCLAEIRATLDATGHLDGLPFMPEMIQHVGKRFRVKKVAHKTCDSIGTYGLRHLTDAVHLETRCDGSAHDGCQAGCLLFWRGAWLKRLDGENGGTAPSAAVTAICDRDQLQRATRVSDPGGTVRYRCQATQLEGLTKPLYPWDVRQYIRDFLSGNVPLAMVVSTTGVAFLKYLIRLVIGRKGVKALKRVLGAFRRDTTNHSPPVKPTKPHMRNLQPGDIVQIGSQKQIAATLDHESKNRGLNFDADMLRHAGGRYRVVGRVERIIDEKTGKMLRITKDCIILDGVTCTALCKRDRLFCPRATYAYWREAWLA
jgi:hypothetical protein